MRQLTVCHKSRAGPGFRVTLTLAVQGGPGRGPCALVLPAGGAGTGLLPQDADQQPRHQAGEHASGQRGAGPPAAHQAVRLWVLHQRVAQPAEDRGWHARLHRCALHCTPSPVRASWRHAPGQHSLLALPMRRRRRLPPSTTTGRVSFLNACVQEFWWHELQAHACTCSSHGPSPTLSRSCCAAPGHAVRRTTSAFKQLPDIAGWESRRAQHACRNSGALSNQSPVHKVLWTGSCHMFAHSVHCRRTCAVCAHAALTASRRMCRAAAHRYAEMEHASMHTKPCLSPTALSATARSARGPAQRAKRGLRQQAGGRVEQRRDAVRDAVLLLPIRPARGPGRPARLRQNHAAHLQRCVDLILCATRCVASDATASVIAVPASPGAHAAARAFP